MALCELNVTRQSIGQTEQAIQTFYKAIEAEAKQDEDITSKNILKLQKEIENIENIINNLSTPLFLFLDELESIAGLL